MRRPIITAACVVVGLVAAGCSRGDSERARTSTGEVTSAAPLGSMSPASSRVVLDTNPVEATVDDTGASTSTGPETGPSFTAVAADWSCPPDTPSTARCYRVDVPANWNEPAGSHISLPVVVVPASGSQVSPDPLVVLAGGPGGSGVDAAAAWSDPHRDVVLYDQRGSGAALPALTCPERNDAWVANLRRDEPFDAEREAIVEAYSVCRTRLEAAGIDLDDYDTDASVRDLDAIRVALGYQEWNLIGASYGARLALAAMRATPTTIRSVVLDSVDDVTEGGPAATQASGPRAFAELVLACRESTACATAHPDLAGEIDAVEQTYDATPVRLQLDLGDGRGPQTFVITGSDMMAGLFQAMYDPALLTLIPSIVGDLAAGDTSIVEPLVRQSVALQDTIAWGMSLSVNCADHAGLDLAADASAIADPGRFALVLAEPLCSEWPVDATSSTFNEPVTSEIPTLVIAGRFDPITPPQRSERAASRLANSTFAVWPNRGHGVTGDPCANSLMSVFLDDPSAVIDLGCVEAIPSLAFA